MKRVQLSEVAGIVMGTAPPGESYNDLQEGLPLIAGASDYGLENPKPKRWTTQASAISEPGDLIICVRATIGDLNWSDRSYCLGRGVAALRPDTEKLNPQYLGHYMNAKKDELSALGTGSTFPAIRKNDLESFQIPLPPLPEQKRIADILDKADAIRRKRREAISSFDKFLPALFSDIFGPEGRKHPLEPLGNHIDFLTSGSRGWAEHYVQSGKRFIRSLDVQMNRIGSDDVVFVNPPAGAEADRTRVRDGDILITITGSKIGRVAFIPESFGEAYVSQHVAILRLKPSLRPEFCSMFMSLSNGGQQQIAKAQYGQTKPGLSLSNIREFQVPVAPIKEQDRFVKMWKRLSLASDKQGINLSESESLFNSLTRTAFSGEL
jgi:type I restriction enzyme S subunit